MCGSSLPSSARSRCESGRTNVSLGQVTRWLLLGLGTTVLGYDVFAYLRGQEGDTISEVIWRYSANFLILPLMAGFLTAHFWWTKKGGGFNPAWTVLAGLGFLALNLYIELFAGPLPPWARAAWAWMKLRPMLLFGLGLLLGRYGWAQ